MRFFIRPGSRRPIHLPAAGKALLAQQEDAAVATLLRRINAARGAAPAIAMKRFLAEMAAIRAQGYARSENASVPDTAMLAMALPVAPGHRPLAIAVSGPLARMRKEEGHPEVDARQSRHFRNVKRYQAAVNVGAPRHHHGGMNRFLALSDFEVAGSAVSAAHAARLHRRGGGSRPQPLRDNRTASAEWDFVPRALRDTSTRDAAMALLGETHTAPFCIAPMGAGAICAYRSDLVLAGTAAAGIPTVTSASFLIPMEKIAAVAGQTGVDRAIAPLKEEVLRDLALLGVTSPAALDAGFLRRLGRG